MTCRDDHAYHAKRAEEELECGDQAVNACISAIHYELAYRHSLLAARRTHAPPTLTLVPGRIDGPVMQDVQRQICPA